MFRVLSLCTLFLLPLAQAVAVEVAPRISDREIIEALADIKAGQQAINQRFEAVDQRFDDLDQKLSGRIDDLHSLMLVILAGIFGLIGFVVWDRRTMIKPLEQQFMKLEEKLQYDLDLQSPEGSKLTRVLHVLRELAQTDPRVAAALKQFTLM
ncbi:MAG: hypothetical protein Q9M13_02710 [Mariprofundales bacterium]|nr:hypothetical protein [Mariprofundales bacterium]